MTDQQKFRYMTIHYRDIYGHYETFAKKIDVARATVHNWENTVGERINSKIKKARIAEEFGLRYEVWTDHYYTGPEFVKHLDDYKIEVKTSEKSNEVIEKNIIGDIIRMTVEEEDMIELLSQESLINIPGNLNKRSPDFMLALAYLLKDRNQIEDALNVIETLMKNNKIFKYAYYNQIQHLKAILLSHEMVKKWDEAIDILLFLYSVSRYHFDQPEIITLTASNYKRKALYDNHGDLKHSELREKDRELLGQALTLYTEAYHLKKDKEKYYDAVNIAYLGKMLEVLDADEEEGAVYDVKKQYDALKETGWKPDQTNWWEVSAEIEFLVLMGKEKEALLKLNEFLEYSKGLKKFEIETTIRQMELYVHFIDDANAKIFLKALKVNWDSLKQY